MQTRAVGWGRGMRPAGWVLSAESRSTSGSAEGPRRRSAPLCKASPRAEPREESEGTARTPAPAQRSAAAFGGGRRGLVATGRREASLGSGLVPYPDPLIR